MSENSPQQQTQPPELPTASIAVPQLDDRVTVEVEVEGQTRTLVLDKNPSQNENLEVLLQQSDGSFETFDTSSSSSYSGTIAEDPNLTVSAVISPRGITAEVTDANGETAFNLMPLDERDSNGNAQHAVSTTPIDAADLIGGNSPLFELKEQETHSDGESSELLEFELDSDGHEGHNHEESSEELTFEESDGETGTFVGVGEVVRAPDDSIDRALVFNEVSVTEAVIGFDVTNESLREGYGGDPQRVVDNIEFFLNTNERDRNGDSIPPNAIYTRDALIKMVAGTIIIRTDPEADPYADADGDVDVTTQNLDRFRDRWNSNGDADGTGFEQFGTRQQRDHSAAVLLAGSSGRADGLARRGTLGQNDRYTITDGSRDGFWRGIARHELGHVFGLSHGHGRLETEPSGSFVQGIMSGNSRRFNTDEVITAQREARESNSRTRQIGQITEHNVRPRPVRDDVTFDLSQDSLTIDVLANDYDANNDPLFLDRYHSTSVFGGTVEVSQGTGDRGQDELIYTPQADFSGTDTFYYWAEDVPQFGEGQNGDSFAEWTLVTVEVNQPTRINTSRENFFYDLGTSDSPVFTGGADSYQRLTPQPPNGIEFLVNGSTPGADVIESRDRESTRDLPNVNDLNRDFIRSSERTTLEHQIADGRYRVTATFGDGLFVSDRISFSAENAGTQTIDSLAPEQFQNIVFDDVLVNDGSLSLTFDDEGGQTREWSLTRLNIQRVGDAPNSGSEEALLEFDPLSEPTEPLLVESSDDFI